MGDIFKFNLKPLIKLLGFISPSEVKEHKEIRKADLATLAEVVNKANAIEEPSFFNGKLNRNKLLLGTTVFYEDDRVTPESIKRIADAGFDFIISESAGPFRKMIAEQCAENELALISKDESLPEGNSIAAALEAGGDLFENYKQIPAHAGDTAGDEPAACLFESMGKYFELYKARFPEKFLFTNLFPAGTPPRRLGAKNYKAYIDEFVEKVPCDYISTDEYPFFSVGFLQKKAFDLALHTYDVIANACRKNGRDFWLYFQTQGCWFDGIYALPTCQQIYWQAYTALAYGAKCLMHISYTPVWGSEAYAMIDGKGNLTEQYLYSKRLNEDLASISPVYMQYESLGALPSKANREESTMKAAMKRQMKSSKEQGFRGIEWVAKVNSVSSALVGYFKHKEAQNYAFMVVNCSGLKKADTSNKIIIALKDRCDAKLYFKNKNVRELSGVKEIKLDLNSGEGVFITLSKQD